MIHYRWYYLKITINECSWLWIWLNFTSISFRTSTFAWDLCWHFVRVCRFVRFAVLVRHSWGWAMGGLLLWSVGIPSLTVHQAFFDPVMLQCFLWCHPNVWVPPNNHTLSLYTFIHNTIIHGTSNNASNKVKLSTPPS